MSDDASEERTSEALKGRRRGNERTDRSLDFSISRAPARADGVAERTHDNAEDDGAGDGGGVCVAHLGGGEVKVVSDDGDQRRSHERAAERDEEAEPCQMEAPLMMRHAGRRTYVHARE